MILYFRVSVTDVAVSPWSIAKGLAAGLGATVIAAAVPAFEAASYRPRLALTRSVLEHRTGRLLPLIAMAGIVAVLLAIVLLMVSGSSLLAGLTALFLLLLGFAVCIPVLVKTLTGWLAPMASRGRRHAGASCDLGRRRLHQPHGGGNRGAGGLLFPRPLE